MESDRYDIYRELSELIGRWYGADLTEAEEFRLRSLLIRTDIPEEFEADRRLILSLSEEGQEEAVIPAELESRINAALDREMRMAIGVRKMGIRIRMRKLLRIVAVIAFCILGVGVGKVLMTKDKTPGLTPGSESSEESRKIMAQEMVEVCGSGDGVSCEEPSVMESPAPERPRTVNPRTSGRPSVSGGRGGERGRHVEENMMADARDNLSVPQNYRIIDNPSEVDEILSSIFGRLENTLDREAVRLASMRLDYESEMIKINSIDNINEKEQIPI